MWVVTGELFRGVGGEGHACARVMESLPRGETVVGFFCTRGWKCDEVSEVSVTGCDCFRIEERGRGWWLWSRVRGRTGCVGLG